MLDILGSMSLTALAILSAGILILAGGGDAASRGRLAAVVGAWFVGITALAGAGLFSRTGALGIPALAVSVFVPIIVGWVALARSPRVQAFAKAIPLPMLVAVHAGRLLGAFFIALYAAGRLPRTFSMTAGEGDMFIGLMALPLAWAIHRRAPGWQWLTLAWNALGTLDLVSALTLGVGSNAGSPLRFIFETPDSHAIGVLPWALIPAILVPLYMLAHISVFARLKAHARGKASLTLHQAA